MYIWFLFENWAWIQFKFKLTYCIMLKQSLFKKYNFTAYIKFIMTWLSRNLHGIYKLALFLKMAELIHVGCIQCIQYHYNLKFNNANWLWIEHLKEFVTCYNWLWTLYKLGLGFSQACYKSISPFKVQKYSI